MTQCVRQWVFFILYGQCRSINNATLAEVKEAGVSDGSVKGGMRTVGNKENEVTEMAQS